MSDDPASIEAWQTQDNWCTRNGWDLLTYLRSKPVIVTTDTYGQLVTNYKATEAVRNLTKQHQERCEMAADEIERIQKKLLGEENAYDILRLENEHLQTDRNNLALSLKELEDKCKRLEVELGRYKRMYCRAVCKNVYASGAKWRIRPNPMRDDGVFIEEDCEPGQQLTYCAFPHQFAHDDAEEIVFLLNRATEDRKEKRNER